MIDEASTTRYAAALLRISQGLLFLAHGAILKLGTFGLAGTMGFFGSLGYPPVLGAVVIVAEILGGLALLAGVAVRWVSLGLLPVMLGALVQHAGNGWLFNAPGGGWEFPAFWAVALVVQAGLGAGAWALDARKLAGGQRAVSA
jgi:putative oxidoreductase